MTVYCDEKPTDKQIILTVALIVVFKASKLYLASLPDCVMADAVILEAVRSIVVKEIFPQGFAKEHSQLLSGSIEILLNKCFRFLKVLSFFYCEQYSGQSL